jgi:CRISPR-associated endonuclease Cas1
LVQLLVKDETDFAGRERQGAKDLVNSMLNYGYGILYSRIWDAVLKARLNPYISFMHTHQAGKPTLIYDLIEEFRPVAVDRVVIALVNKKHKLRTDERGLLAHETRDILIKKILERLNSFETFRGTRMRLSEVIRYQAKEVARYVTGEIKTYKPYSFKW